MPDETLNRTFVIFFSPPVPWKMYEPHRFRNIIIRHPSHLSHPHPLYAYACARVCRISTCVYNTVHITLYTRFYHYYYWDYTRRTFTWPVYACVYACALVCRRRFFSTGFFHQRSLREKKILLPPGENALFGSRDDTARTGWLVELGWKERRMNFGKGLKRSRSRVRGGWAAEFGHTGLSHVSLRYYIMIIIIIIETRRIRCRQTFSAWPFCAHALATSFPDCLRYSTATHHSHRVCPRCRRRRHRRHPRHRSSFPAGNDWISLTFQPLPCTAASLTSPYL